MASMKKGGVFTSDPRNIGGRQTVIERMLAHQHNLRSIQTEATGGRHRKEAVRAAPKKGKGCAVDTSAPATYHLSGRLSANRRAAGQRIEGMGSVHSDIPGYVLEQHARRTRHMIDKMRQYPSPSTRLKNPHDPFAYPPLLIRTDDAVLAGGKEAALGHSLSSTSLGAPGGGYTKSRGLLPHTARELQHGLPLDVDNIVKPRRIYKANPLSHSIVPITSSPIMPRSHSQAQLRRSPNGSPSHTINNNNHQHDRFLSSIDGSRSTSSLPPARTHTAPARVTDEKEEKIADMVDGGDDPYEQLKSRLFSLIVEHRIYREEHLLQLFDKARAVNSHLDPVRLNTVIAQLQSELEVGRQEHANDGADDWDGTYNQAPVGLPGSSRPKSATATATSTPATTLNGSATTSAATPVRASSRPSSRPSSSHNTDKQASAAATASPSSPSHVPTSGSTDVHTSSPSAHAYSHDGFEE